MGRDAERIEQEIAGEERPARPRNLSAAYLQQALDALHAAGHAPSLYPPWSLEPALTDLQRGFAGLLAQRDSRRTQLRSSVLFAALAAESYVNEFLAAHVTGRDLKALDRMPCVEKYVLGTRLAYGEVLFRRDDEVMPTIVELFKLRNRLVHPRPGFGQPGLLDTDTDTDTDFDALFAPTTAARYVVMVGGAADLLTRRAYGFDSLDMPGSLIWTGREIVYGYAKRAALPPPPDRAPEKALVEQLTAHVLARPAVAAPGLAVNQIVAGKARRQEDVKAEGPVGACRHVVVRPTLADNSLRLWMTERLRFHTSQPPWQKQIARDLVQDMQTLVIDSESVFSAVFISPTRDRVDAENVLLYNLHAASFARMPPRLRFERSYATPPPPPIALAGPVNFHHVYSRAAPDDGFTCWTPQAENIAIWRDVPCSKVVGDRAAWQVWLSMCEATDLELDQALSSATDQFGVSVVVTVPPRMKVTATAAVKPLIDGVLASFQRFSPSDTARAAEVAAQLVAALPGRAPRALADHLTRPEGRLFAQPPFNAHGRLALNPCDDRCVAGEIAIVSEEACASPRISGTIYPVASRHAAASGTHR